MEKRNLTAVTPTTLFSVIRAGLGLGTEAAALSEEDCADLLSIGTRQSVRPILFAGLKKLGAPEEVIREFDKSRSRDLYDFVQLNEAQKTVSAVLDECRIPYVPLKGAVLRRLYPAPELRTSGDLDVLVREEDLDRAVRDLESRADFKTQRLAYHDVSMTNSRVLLELHFNIKEDMENIDRLLSRAWDYAEPTGEGSCWSFTPEFQIFHVIAHMCYHFLHGGLGIRPFLDLWLLRHKTQFDEDAVIRICSECGILTFYKESCALSEVWLGDAEHTETTEMLERFCLSGGVFGSAGFKRAGQQRKTQGWKYFLRRAFPPAAQVKEYYRDKPGKKHLLIYYYWKRFIRWLSRKRRRKLKTLAAEIFSRDREFRDAAEELFRRLDL